MHNYVRYTLFSIHFHWQTLLPSCIDCYFKFNPVRGRADLINRCLTFASCDQWGQSNLTLDQSNLSIVRCFSFIIRYIFPKFSLLDPRLTEGPIKITVVCPSVSPSVSLAFFSGIVH